MSSARNCGRIDTLPLNLYQVASSGMYLNNWHPIFTYVLPNSLPCAVFTIFQRQIIVGVTSGTVE